MSALWGPWEGQREDLLVPFDQWEKKKLSRKSVVTSLASVPLRIVNGVSCCVFTTTDSLASRVFIRDLAYIPVEIKIILMLKDDISVLS